MCLNVYDNITTQKNENHGSSTAFQPNVKMRKRIINDQFGDFFPSCPCKASNEGARKKGRPKERVNR